MGAREGENEGKKGVDAQGETGEYAAVYVYFLVYQLLTQPDAESFTKLKAALATHETQFPLTELKELYIYCTNFNQF